MGTIRKKWGDTQGNFKIAGPDGEADLLVALVLEKIQGTLAFLGCFLKSLIRLRHTFSLRPRRT